MNATGLAAALGSILGEIVRAGRSPRFLLLAICLPLGLYLAYTAIGIGGAVNAGDPGIGLPAYLTVSMGVFGAMSAAVGTAAGPFRAPRDVARPHLAARIGAALLLALAPLLLFGLVGSSEGIRLSGVGWSELILSLWLGVVPFIVLGLLLGQTLEPETGEIVLVGALVVLAILGGLFQPIDTLPATLGALAHVVPSYRLADLGWTTLADHAVDPVDVLMLAGYTVAIGAIVVWRTRSEGARGAERTAHDDGERAR
jgi:ABC-2 type transport system permease protein